MTTKPTIELKSISVNAALSEETHCFSATLYVDGEKWGQVLNRGYGGCDDFHGAGKRNYDDIAKLNERIKATYPTQTLGDYTMEADLELVCGDIINDFLMVKEVRKLTKGKVAFRDGAEIYTIKTTDVAKTTAHVRTKYPNAVILNDLPEAEAVQVLRQAA